MPNRRILKDTAYVYHFVGESNYQATYVKYTVKHCSLQHHFGVARGNQETEPKNSARLYVFDKDSVVTDAAGNVLTFCEPDIYESLTSAEKATRWTITNDEKDYFGETDGVGAPTTGLPNYYKCTGYTRHDTGSKRITHTEIFGK